MKRLIASLAGFVLLAVACTVPALVQPTAEVPPTATAENGPTATAALPPTATLKPTWHMDVWLDPQSGKLMAQLAAGAQEAASQGLRPFLEFDAKW